MTQNIPDFLTHYSRSQPFRSMTSISPEKWSEAIIGLNETNAWGTSRFSDPNYLPRRLEVERQLRNEFITKNGRPETSHPIYFFLGRHKRFEEHERNKGFMILLKEISSDFVSFTYGDSLLAYNEDYRSQSGEVYQNPLCAKLYRIEELEDLFSHTNYPKDSPLSIEAQIWIMPSKEIVKHLVR